MSCIGFWCWDDHFSFVVLSGTADEPSLQGRGSRRAPKGLPRPEALQWLRREVHEVLNTHSPQRAYYKATEGNSRTKDLRRGEFEGVLQEAAASHQLRLIIEGRVKAQVKRDTAFQRPARYLDHLLQHPALADVSTPTYCEACLAALCGLVREAGSGTL